MSKNKNKWRLVIDQDGAAFISPTGNGFAGSYWWSVKALFRLFPCLISRNEQVVLIPVGIGIYVIGLFLGFYLVVG